MGLFFDNSKFELLKKTQENLELSQKNVELVAHALEGKIEKRYIIDSLTFTDNEKLKAAYALNLCMVSVSQIIDYNDMYILDQEYQAILNNLNLEEIPKDEALLNILKQLLDVITFFRIQDGDKKFFEKEYQQKMKNAVWSAIPNIGLLVTGGNPFTMAVSLASQVGIGYMNYRKEKAQNLLDKERNEWQLQRSAMEQLNGLRRELFDTAWRLADRYQFPDRYRITEQQITRYNEILLDSDCLRRYERLDYIKEKFEAYPPFWYYLGAAANAVYQNDCFDSDIRERYREYACEHFSKFIKNTKGNLLREDQILAAGALEYFSLLKGTGSEDKEYLESLINIAIDAAGNAYDVLEICAFAYMQLNIPQKAAKIFRMLVNNEYNQTMNAQMLSSIYAFQYTRSYNVEIKGDYKTLATRVDPFYLFPMPINEKDDLNKLQSNFINAQKELLCINFAFVLKSLIHRYSNTYNKCVQDPSANESPEILQTKLFEVLNDLSTAVRSIPLIKAEQFYWYITRMILKNREEFISININFESLTKDAFTSAAKGIRKEISELSEMSQIACIESDIRAACANQKIALPEILPTNVTPNNRSAIGSQVFDKRLFGVDYQKEQDEKQEMSACIKEFSEKIISDNEKKKSYYFYLPSDDDFEKYFKRHQNIEEYQERTLAILNDTTISDEDLLLTTEGVLLYTRLGPLKRREGRPIAYANIKESNAADSNIKLQFGKHGYAAKGVDLKKLSMLFNCLATIEQKYNPSHQDTANYNDNIEEEVEKILHLPYRFG